MPETTEPQAGTEAPTAQEQPPWGEDFNAEKAWNLIKGLRTDKEKLAARPVLDDDAKRKLSEYERLEQASKSDLDRKTEEVNRWQTEAERWRDSTVTARIEALAAPNFEYPSDAVGKLDPKKYLDAGGQIDEASIKADLDALLTERPSWARATGTAAGPRVPAPNRSQGTSAAGGAPASPADEFGAFLRTRLST